MPNIHEEFNARVAYRGAYKSPEGATRVLPAALPDLDRQTFRFMRMSTTSDMYPGEFCCVPMDPQWRENWPRLMFSGDLIEITPPVNTKPHCP